MIKQAHIQIFTPVLSCLECSDQGRIKLPGPDVGGWGGGPSPLAMERQDKE